MTSLGMLLNFLFSPPICWIIALLLLSNYPDVAVGLILVSVVPCAGMALVWTGLLEGDVSIVSVIEVATMISAPFLIPFLMLAFAGLFVTIDSIEMFKTFIYTVLSPLLGGIALREIAERKRYKELRSSNAGYLSNDCDAPDVYGYKYNCPCNREEFTDTCTLARFYLYSIPPCSQLRI
ncbi:MAG: arsenic resistance protein [Archaeoglobaceae archaeon]